MKSTAMASRSILPARSPLPFPEPVFGTAKRRPAAVAATPRASNAIPSLERQSSVASNLLVIEEDEEDENTNKGKTYLIQRKLRDTPFGSLRVAYALRQDDSGVYHVTTDESDESDHDTLAVAIENRAEIQSESSNAQCHMAELAALQMIASQVQADGAAPLHVQFAKSIAADKLSIYTITSHYKDGSLYDYCTARGTLSENDARFFFRQILSGLETLEGLALCHRSLSLENVHLHGATATIVGLRSVLRIPLDDENDNTPHMFMPQQLVGSTSSRTQYMAPELLKEEAFDGFAVDLWSAGVMLLAMLIGSDALFLLPSHQDCRYKEICIDGNLEVYLQKLGRSVSPEVVDLLQNMLLADPDRRLTRAAVAQHAWVTKHTESPSMPSSSVCDAY